MRLVVGVTKNEHVGDAVFQAPVVCHQSLQPCGEAAKECDKSSTMNVTGPQPLACTRATSVTRGYLPTMALLPESTDEGS